MKIYRGMDIGTAKPAPAERQRVPHHLIDIVDAWETFDVARYVAAADAAIDAIHGRGRPAVVVGGTVLYFKALYHGLFDGPPANEAIRAEIRARAADIGLERLHAELAAVDPVAAERIHRNDLRRIERALEVFRLTGTPISRQQRQWAAGPRRGDWDWRLLGLRHERDAGNRRINERVRRMLDQGLVAEAQRLWHDPRGLSDAARQAVGYAELFAHFRGESSLDDAIEAIKINSRHLAKSQRTWLRRVEHVAWLSSDDASTARARAALT
jgi:tRNA dimethylallyltransferase